MQRARSWPIAACLFALALGAYLANGRILPSAGDDIPNRLIPFSILGWGTLTLDPFRAEVLQQSVNPLFLRERDGHLLSLYPPGAAILALPIYLPCYLWLRGGGHGDAQYLGKASAVAGKLAAAIIAAACVAVLFIVLRRRVEAATAAIIALAFGLGSGMWMVSSQLLWQHGPGVLCLLLGLYCLAFREISPGRAAAAGLWLAAAVTIRPQNALFLAAGAALIAWCSAGGAAARGRSLAAFAAGSLIPLGAIFAYNEHYFGYLSGGYGFAGVDRWFTLSSLPQGLAGLLLSPNRGLLCFSPVAIVGAWGMVLAFRRWRAEPFLACFSAAAVLSILLHAAFTHWTGGGSFGPRYLTETLPVLALAATLAVARLTAAGKLAALLLLGWSVLVEMIGAAAFPASRWNARMAPETASRAWDLHHILLAEDLRTWWALRGRPTPPAPRLLPASAFRVEWQRMAWWPGDARPALRPRMQARALVTFENAGDQTWPDPAAIDPARSGAYAVRLACRWRNATWAGPYGARSDLREPLPPRSSTTLMIFVVAPAAPGDYALQFDLVQENVAWFEDRGAHRFLVPVRVEPR